LPCCGFTGLQAIYKKNGVFIGGNTAMFLLKLLNRDGGYHAFSIRKFT